MVAVPPRLNIWTGDLQNAQANVDKYTTHRYNALLPQYVHRQRITCTNCISRSLAVARFVRLYFYRPAMRQSIVHPCPEKEKIGTEKPY